MSEGSKGHASGDDKPKREKSRETKKRITTLDKMVFTLNQQNIVLNDIIKKFGEPSQEKAVEKEEAETEFNSNKF